MSDGWADSAAAWIAEQGQAGDRARRFVLDPPMLERVAAGGFRRALDIGCGEGRFCRMLRARGIAATGIDPTGALIAEARRRDPDGGYRLGRAEALDFEDASFDLVISYLTLIDIPDLAGAVAEMARVLAPGGALLVANICGPRRRRPCLAGRLDRTLRSTRLPPDGRGDRRFRQRALHRAAPFPWLRPCRPASGHRLEARALGGQRADDAPPGRRRNGPSG